LLLLVPALALAAPRHKKKTTPPPTPTEGSGSGSGSGATNAEPAAPPIDQALPSAAATPAPAPGAGSGSGSAAPTDQPPPKTEDTDVDSLRQEYLSLRDELFKSRARANAVASQLYSTRMSIKLAWTSGRYYGVSKASIRLDGATVYEDTTGAIAGDDGVRFDGYVAPGRHLVTFHVEATGKDDDSFSSSTETQIAVKAVPSKDLVIAAKARDGGDIAYQWKRSEHGSYGLGIDVSVKTMAPPPEAGGKGGKK